MNWSKWRWLKLKYERPDHETEKWLRRRRIRIFVRSLFARRGTLQDSQRARWGRLRRARMSPRGRLRIELPSLVGLPRKSTRSQFDLGPSPQFQYSSIVVWSMAWRFLFSLFFFLFFCFFFFLFSGLWTFEAISHHDHDHSNDWYQHTMSHGSSHSRARQRPTTFISSVPHMDSSNRPLLYI